MLTYTSEEREGALLRRLKEAGHGAKPGGFGFATGAEGGAKRRAMVIVARLAHASTVSDDAQALVAAGADGVEIALRDAGRSGGITEAVAGVNVPCGIFIEGAGDWVGVTEIAGVDWVHVGPGAPARLLAGKGVSRLVTLTPDTPPGRVPGLATLKADIVVVDGAGLDGALTLDTLLALRTIQGATQRPVLAGSGLGLTPDDVAVLHDHGVEGLLVTGGAAALRAFVEAVEKLQ